MLPSIQTPHEVQLISNLPPNLPLQVERITRGGAFLECVLIGTLDLLADCRPLFSLVHLRHDLGEDVDARLLQHRCRSTAVMRVNQIC